MSSARLTRALQALPLSFAFASTALGMELEQVVITATPLRETSLETAQPTRAIEGETLLRRRDASLGETLAQEPGVSASWFGPQSSRPVIRGLGGERVQVYHDGADSLDASALSNDHAVTIDPLLAERIEIVRGPATLMFGNSASAGLVNVVSRRIPRSAGERPLRGAIELRANSALDERALAAQAEFGRDGWRMQADLHRRESGDVSIAEFASSAALRAERAAAGEPPEEMRGRLANSAAESRGGGFGLSRVGDFGHVGVSVSRFGTEYEIPGPGKHDEHGNEEPLAGEAAIAAARIGDGDGVYLDMGQTRYDFDAELRQPFAGIAALRLRAGWNDYEHREIEPGGEVGTTFVQQGLEARAAAEHEPFAGWRGVLGLQWREVDLEAIGEEAYVPASVTRNVGVYLFEERAFGALTIELGARLERQRIELGGLSSPRYEDDALSGSAGAIWRFADNRRLTLNLSSTERHPTATELFAEGPHVAVSRYEIGSAGLGTERAQTADLALRGEFGRLRYTVGAFVKDYSDYIFPELTGEIEDDLPVVVYNSTDARFTGFEAEAAWRSLDGPIGTWSARLFGDYVRARDARGEPLPQIPPLRLGASVGVDRGPLGILLTAIWHDSQDRLGALERATDGFTLVDLDLTWRGRVGDRPMTWFVRGSNLLDEDARRHASPLKDFAPLPGRAVGAGFRFDF
jgi:iron complex outermembrane receptor protein